MIQRLNNAIFHRHLVWEFLRRDLQARYAGSAMGFFWSVIHPLILLVLYTFVFGIILQVKIDARGLETGFNSVAGFALYIFCGLLPWFAYQESWVRSTTCIVDNAHLIKQVRFPAKVLPAYLTLSSLVNQLIGAAILVMALLITFNTLPITLMLFPLVLLLELVFFFGVGLLFATLNTYFRDIAPLVTIAAMVLMWGSPLFYTLRMVESAPGWVTTLMFFNPFTYLVELNHHVFLHGFLYHSWPPLWYWGVFTGIALLTFLIGYISFTRCHREFADLL